MVNWGPIEICFIVDLGENMDKWFKVFKKIAIRELEKIHDELRGYISVRAAFIGYRANIECQSMVDFEFSNNLMYLQSKINSLKTYGPHQCKSMRDAYEIANELEWSNYAGGTIIHIGTSPPHGVKYHDQTIHDMYPYKIPPKIPIECIIERMTFKGLNLVIFQMHPCMNIVVDIIEKSFHNTNRVHRNEITVFNKIITEEQFQYELIQQIRSKSFKIVNGN